MAYLGDNSRLASVGIEQEVWRAAHAAGAKAALDDDGMALLRQWTSGRMRREPFRVFDGASVTPRMLPSFRTALGHAANEIAAGRPLD